MKIDKGTICFLVDENKELNNQQISMDKDRDLNIGDIFKWNEDLGNLNPIPFVVVGFIDHFPLVVECVL